MEFTSSINENAVSVNVKSISVTAKASAREVYSGLQSLASKGIPDPVMEKMRDMSMDTFLSSLDHFSNSSFQKSFHKSFSNTKTHEKHKNERLFIPG